MCQDKEQFSQLHYCFWTGDGKVIHHSINLPTHPAKTYMYCSRALIGGLCKCDCPQNFEKQK